MYPRHVGIIMDGNRRFSKRLMKAPWKGHEWGAKKVEKLIDWCRELDIRELTLYTFSIQNFNRPKEEFEHLMRLFRESFKKLHNDKRIDDYRIRIRAIGRLYLFPEDIQEMLNSIMEKTKDYDSYIINFAMAYGGREEIVDAVRAIAKDVKKGKVDIQDIDESLFSGYLYASDDPDLVIRTGGEKRTSNFLPWQTTYSELYFIDKMWPEFEEEDFIEAIEDFKRRKRRFGR